MTTGTGERLAVVVGNSSGIGLALTRRLLADGWTVAGLSRSPSDLTHERYRHHVADVVDPGLAAALAGLVGDRQVDLCVYAAGVGDLLDLADLKAQTRAIEVNLLGAARVVEAVLPGMVAARRGQFVGLSSLADVAISPDAPGYAASKAGLSAYLQGLALAVRAHGVTITTVRFGFVDTKMAKAPTTPMMISADEAAARVLAAVRSRRAVVAHPRLLALAVRALRTVSIVRLRGRVPAE